MKSKILILLITFLVMNASAQSNLPNFLIALRDFQSELTLKTKQEIFSQYFETPLLRIGHTCGSPADTTHINLNSPEDSNAIQLINFKDYSLAHFRQLKSGTFEIAFFPSALPFQNQKLWFDFKENRYSYHKQDIFIGMGVSFFLYCKIENNQLRFIRLETHGC